jgi:hypothetical protein
MRGDMGICHKIYFLLSYFSNFLLKNNWRVAVGVRATGNKGRISSTVSSQHGHSKIS